MGGRGQSSSSGRGRSGGSAISAGNATGGRNSGVSAQAPSPANTPVVPNATTVLSSMTDQQLADLYNRSVNVDMPNHLNDVSDMTQKFVFTAGVNELPQVLDDAAFNKYLSDNNIRQSQLLARSTGGADYSVNGVRVRLSSDQVTDMIKYGVLNYIGGKHGGMAYGAGTYFDQNGGTPTGYGGGNVSTMVAALSKNAKPITLQNLRSQTAVWSASHPKFANAVGSFSRQNASIYALAQGYNVITSGSGYHNVIDRSAIVIRKRNY